MINNQLINPASIVVVGGSNSLVKPGGKLLNNIITGAYAGRLYCVNQKEREVQGIKSFPSVNDLPEVELAIIAIPASQCIETVRILAEEKNTKAFIIISAGFGELNDKGKELESQLLQIINRNEACLLGPNCIGLLNKNYHGVFTTPIPLLYEQGCDLISSSGATAVFIMEAGIPIGLKFSSVFSVGNGTHIGVEEVLEYLDFSFDEHSSQVKLLYLENISNPDKFLKHCRSLIQKGCKIAAIKAGSTSEGSRAAASHTGAMITPDKLVRALFLKAGVVYCSSREELITTASVFYCKELRGKNIAIITHAGGSAVMLTDALVKGGLHVPEIKGADADELLNYLNSGSSVSNPIDFLATGTADQLGIIIDYCEHKFTHIDGMIVVFGSPGLFDVANVYKVLNVKMNVCRKPIFPVLPSIINAQKEIQYFLSKGQINFPDEVVLGEALCAIYNNSFNINDDEIYFSEVNKSAIRAIINNSKSEILNTDEVNSILIAADIPVVPQYIVTSLENAINHADAIGYPLVMKVVGPIHKTDVDGVALNVFNQETVIREFKRLMNIQGAAGVLFQKMLTGIELFCGVHYESKFGHSIHFGLGGIFVEVLNDIQTLLLPVKNNEIEVMIKQLKGYPLMQGMRGKKGVDEILFSEIIMKVAGIIEAAPEIIEMDLNPLIGSGTDIKVVDARIKIMFP